MLPKSKIKFLVDGSCFLLLIPILLFLPLQWIIGWLFAALVHEFGHLLALKLLKIKIHTIKVSIGGASISTEAISPIKEAICTLAGPAAGLSILRISHLLPHTALFALVQSAYNLLPVYPLDGGRVLRCILSAIFRPNIAMVVGNTVTGIVIIGFLLGGVIASVKYSFPFILLLFPLIPILFVVWKNSLHCRQKNSTIRKRKYNKGNYL